MNAADYDRFAVVVYAPPDVRAEVEEIRRLAPPSGRPMMEAHVTIKGSFVQPVDLDRIAERVRDGCAAAEPFPLTTEEIRVWTNTVVLKMGVTDAHANLHWELVRQLKDLCVTDYYGEDIGHYSPHLTLVQDIPADQIEAALAIIERYRPSYAFTATEATLAGRRGGQVWEPLATFPIGNRTG